MKHNLVPRFTHTFLIYEADALPESYHGKLFGVAPLLSHVVMSDIFARGSTLETKDIGHPITSKDDWFKPVDIKLGPDGGIYVADWYDAQVSHLRNSVGQIDRTNGRVYRLIGRDVKPTALVDLAKLSTPDLIKQLSSSNKCLRQTALQVIGDRKDPAAIPILVESLRKNTGQVALESIWALNLSGGLDEPRTLEFLEHPDPYVRLWTARLACDFKKVSPSVAAALANRAKVETDVEARAQLACSARRIPAAESLPIVQNLLTHSEDKTDPMIPLLLWWDIEAKAESDRSAVLALFENKNFWSLPIVQQTIVERIMRRYAATGLRKDLLSCAQLLKLAPDQDSGKRLMAGFEAAMSGRSVANLPEELAEGLAKFEGGSIILGLRQGREDAVDEVIRVLEDSRGDKSKQLQYVQLLSEIKLPRTIPVLLKLAKNNADSALQGGAMVALQRYPNPEIGTSVLATIPGMTDDIRGEALAMLASRSNWALQLVEAVDQGKIDPQTIPSETVARLRRQLDPKIAELTKKHWGQTTSNTSAALQSEIEHLAKLIRAEPGTPKVGEKLFGKTCGTCHAMFGAGGRIGPELTTYRRDDLDNMLLNIVNPSAEIREGYGTFLVSTNDGRLLSGILMDQDPKSVVIRGSDGHDLAIPRDEIEEMKASPSSLMPEGLLKDLKPTEIVDLFAFLRSTQPPK